MTVLVVGPHPDDELLGCGGSILRWKSEGTRVAWCLVTSLHNSPEAQERQRIQVEAARKFLGLSASEFFWLAFPAADLDQVPTRELVGRLHDVFLECQPRTLLIPFGNDVHSDHRVVHEAAVAASKWFRQSSVERVLAYETLSETEQAMDSQHAFIPNVFVDIEPWLQPKLDVLGVYQQELEDFPFPRSLDAVEALAKFRGTTAGFKAAEAFMLLRERCGLDVLPAK